MILVTGAGGFIGKAICARLLVAGRELIPLFGRGDFNLTQDHDMFALKQTGFRPKTVIHLAGHVAITLKADSVDSSCPPLPGEEDIAQLYAANVGATANVLDFCLHAGVRHLIFASSQAVYGFPQGSVLTEESPCAPLEHYAASKLFCEVLLMLGVGEKLAVTILRFPGVFSEQRKSGIIYGYCKAAINSKQIRVEADFPLPFDVIHLDDVVDAIERTVDYGGKDWTCLNISYGEPCSLDLLADAIADLVPGCQVEHAKIPQPIVQMNADRAHVVLEWQPRPRRFRLAGMMESLRDSEDHERRMIC